MYQNLSRRTSTANRPKPLPIRLDAIPFNEKAAYVESVCASLIDSRFGPGRTPKFIFQRTESPELEPAICYDLTPEGPIPGDPVMPDSKPARCYLAAMLLAELKQSEVTASSIRTKNISPSNLGRGSPQIFRDAHQPSAR